LVPTDSDSNICLKPPVPKEPQAIVINTPEMMTNRIIKFTQSNAHLHRAMGMKKQFLLPQKGLQRFTLRVYRGLHLSVYIYTSNNQHIHISLHFYVE